MLRVLVVLSVLTAGLWAWNRALDARESSSRPADPAIEPLLTREQWASRTVAAISISSANGNGSLFYARKHGRWLCREAFGATADESAIKGLLESLLQAHGVLRTDDPARASAYGFDDALRIELHGPKVMDRPDRDVFAAVELGASTDRTAFVRVVSSARILEIDRDPRVHLGVREATSLPPMIDTRLLAGSTPDDFRGFERFVFTFFDGQKFSVESQPGAEKDALPDWFVVQGSRRDPCPSWRIGGYTGLWLRERFEGLANPSRADELGLDPPHLTIELYPHGHEPIRYDVGEPTPGRDAYLWNRTTNTLAIISRDLQEKIIPDAAMFLDETRPNPWERWLSK